MSHSFLPKSLCILFLFLFAACEQKSSSLVDPRGVVPVLTSAVISPTIVNTDTINIGPTRDPADLLTIPVRINGIVRSDGSTEVRYAARFSGSYDDIAAGVIPVTDSAFAGTASVKFFRSSIGTIFVTLSAVETHGETSTAFILPLTITRLNHPPVISALSAPDTVRPSLILEFRISLRASDPDGASDIRYVFRTGTTGNIFYLNDSGVNGDGVAGDGIYTETVSLNPPPPEGSYTFTFRAVDRSNDTSNVLTKTITVRP